jgi:hypothetical protein
VRAGELDARPGLDLVVVNRGEPTGTGIPPDRFTLLAGRGDGTFAPPAPLGLNVVEPKLRVCCLRLVDLDRDGVDDVVFRNSSLQGSSIATNKALRPVVSAEVPGPQPEPQPRTSARDLTAPRLAVRALPRRVSAGVRSIVVRGSCDEACTLTATGRVSARIGRRAVTAALAPARATVTEGRVATLTLRVPRRARALARAAIAARRAPIATLRLSARDLAGNAAPTRVLTLRIGGGRPR